MLDKLAEFRLGELLGYCAIIVAVLSTFLEISKIKINPWSALGRAIGKVINKDVIDSLNEVKQKQAETQQRLDNHIYIDDERNADLHRTYILRFNTELLRGIEHTEEDFVEIMYNIDFYERYCKNHDEYQNNRAVHAIKHIKKVYDECLEKGTFLKAKPHGN